MATKKLEEEVKKLSEQEARAANLAEAAQEKAEAAGAASVDALFNKARDFGAGLSWEKFSTQIATSIQNQKAAADDEDGKPRVQVATVRGQAKARSLAPKKAVVKQTPAKGFNSTKPKEDKGKQTEKTAEVRKVFGGLFKQETIYVDDD